MILRFSQLIFQQVRPDLGCRPHTGRTDVTARPGIKAILDVTDRKLKDAADSSLVGTEEGDLTMVISPHVSS